MYETRPEITPDRLQTAGHTVWLEHDLLTGDGIIEMHAPEVFTMWTDGLERVRFGKIIGLATGVDARLPILPELLPITVEAAREHPGECVMLEEIEEGQDTLELWDIFFRNQVKTVGHVAINAIMSHHPDVSANNPQLNRHIMYAASLVEPGVDAFGLVPTDYDSLDVFNYLGITTIADTHDRDEIAARMRTLVPGEDGNGVELSHRYIRHLAAVTRELFGIASHR